MVRYASQSIVPQSRSTMIVTPANGQDLGPLTAVVASLYISLWEAQMGSDIGRTPNTSTFGLFELLVTILIAVVIAFTIRSQASALPWAGTAMVTFVDQESWYL